MTQQPQKPMSKAEEAGTLLSIVANLGPALTLPEISQIKSRLFRLVDLDVIQGPTIQEMAEQQRQAELDQMLDEMPEPEQKLEVVRFQPEEDPA